MRFELEFEESFPHPVEKVWHALTDRGALAGWLMDNDYDAASGRRFRMWCDGRDGSTDTYLCEVVKSEPPRRLVWSWVLEGMEAGGAMTVTFELTPLARGTRLIVRHSGDLDPEAIEAFKGGWPTKLDQMEEALPARPSGRR